MKPHSHSILRFVAALVLSATFSLRLLAGSSGVSGNEVTYNPQSHGVNLTVPSTDSFPLTITAPANYTAYPVTVQLQVIADTDPLGNLLAALGYIHLSTPSLTFTGPGSQTVTVSMDFPLTAVTLLVPSPTYTYHVVATGWTGTWTNSGCAISAGLSTPNDNGGGTPNGPLVSIVTPEDGRQFTVAPNAFPASIAFQYNASTDSVSPVINTYSATLQDEAGAITAVPITADGFGTANITGNGTLVIPSAGTYTVSVHVENPVGSAEDTNTFTVVANAVPPTVAIQTPAPGTPFTYRAGSDPTEVTLSFTGHSDYAVRSLIATLDGNDVTGLYTPTGIGTPDAAGSFTVGYTTAGTHILTVTVADDYGAAGTSTNYSVDVVAPTPAINITTPTEGQEFTITAPATSADVPFQFITTSNNGFVVDAVSATLNGNPVTLSNSGLHSATTTSTGTFTSLAPGSYTFVANGSSAGIPVTQTVHFTVKASNPPPSVVIDTPAPNATFTRLASGPALSIPLTFTGTSHATGGVITGVTATLDGVPVTFTPVVGSTQVVNNATLTVSAAGTHTIKVTATDFVGTATATQTFTVTVIQGYSISGTVFFDVDTDSVFDAAEFGLSGVKVTLRTQSGTLVGTATTAADGTYSFSQLAPGTYVVSATTPAGLAATNGVSRTGIVRTANVTGVDIGFMIDFCALQGKSANGYTIGYWKNNVDKAISGKCSGTQVSAATIRSYTDAIGSLALSPYDGITMKNAVSVMSSTSSAPKDLLSKQLLASEYNYENKAYINGNGAFTFLFVWWGEYVLTHSSSYSSTYILWAKDWFDGYNNSHGGAICGPSLNGTSCTGGSAAGGGSCDNGSYSQHSDSNDCDRGSYSDHGSKGGSDDGSNGSYSNDRSGRDHNGGSNSDDRSGGDCDSRSDRDSSRNDRSGGSRDDDRGGGSGSSWTSSNSWSSCDRW